MENANHYTSNTADIIRILAEHEPCSLPAETATKATADMNVAMLDVRREYRRREGLSKQLARQTFLLK